MTSFGENGFQESKHEEQNDENSSSNPVEVHEHDLVSVFFAMQHRKTETSYAIYAIVIIALCSLFLLDLSFGKKNMLKKLTSQVATMSRSVNKNFGMCQICLYFLYILFYMHCDYLNKFIWGGQDSKHEEKIDENLGSNPIEVQTHSLVSVFFAMQHWLN